MDAHEARSAEVVITYEGKDISRDIAPFLINFTYTDNDADKSDDINLTLEDRKGRWRDTWFPVKGDKIVASISAHEWEGAGKTENMPCGTFEVTQVDYSGPPCTISIKGVSVPVSKAGANEKHTKAWENVKLNAIAQDIADKGGLKLYFDVPDNPLFERKDQVEKSDLDFLKDLCKECGAAVKVTADKLVCYDKEKNEERAAAGELKLDDKKLISYRFSSKAAGIYKAAHLQYHNAVKNLNIDAVVQAKEAEGTERVLELNDKCGSIAEGKKIAEKKLTEANNKEITGSVTLMGDMRFLGGNNIEIKGFGAFDGKYLIEKASHSVSSSGYVTTLELHMGKAEKEQLKAKKASKKKKSGGGEKSVPIPVYTGTDVYRRN